MLAGRAFGSPAPLLAASSSHIAHAIQRRQAQRRIAAMSGGAGSTAAATPAATPAAIPAAAIVRRPAALVWFRRDFRLADHEPLHSACLSLHQGGSLLLPFFCLDERELLPAQTAAAGTAGSDAGANGGSSSGLGLPQLGPHRLRLVLEAAASLRASLQRLGSDLLWAQGRPEAAVGQLVALAAAAGSTDVALFYYQLPGSGGQSAEVEDAVAAAFAAAAAEHGLTSGVHRSWGHTLYHPDDLPYRLFRAPAGSRADGGSDGQKAQAAAGGGGGAAGQAAAAAGEEGAACRDAGQHGHIMHNSSGGSLAQERQPDWRRPERYSCLPLVMSDFRRTVQAHTPVRAPLPAPQAASAGGAAASSGSGSGSPAVLPPLPADVAAAAEQAGWLAPIPTQLASVYAAAGPAAQTALQLWEELSGQSSAELAPAGSGRYHRHSAVPFAMGEEEALARLRSYLGLGQGQGSEGDEPAAAGLGGQGASGQAKAPPLIETYQATRMMAVGVDSSLKLSAFLALGCISPRTVYTEAAHLADPAAPAVAEDAAADGSPAARPPVAAQPAVQPAAQKTAVQLEWREPGKGADNKGWRWLLVHLGIRDYFLFLALKEGAALERAEGLCSERPAQWRHDEALFRRWARGQTGLPFVDACMRELAATGYTSNRGRQNVASFFSKALGLDWRQGAEYFEATLADADWALNRGNWAYNSGVGSDPRDRTFRTVSQGLQYDPQAELLEAWLPELAGLKHSPQGGSSELMHRPWEAPPALLAAAGVRLGEGGGEAGRRAGDAGAAAAGDEAAPAGSSAGGSCFYPLPLVDPASQTGRGPKRAQQAGQPRA